MFAGKSVFEMFHAGGYAMWVLLACSVVSIAIALERSLAYWQARLDPGPFMARVRRHLERGDVGEALNVCSEARRAVLPAVVRSALERAGRPERDVRDAVDRQLALQSLELDRWTILVGTIGGIAVYIGLAGTVIGIIRAFGALVTFGPEGTTINAAGISAVIPGIAEALVATATGLFVAVPAVIFYNYFQRRKDVILTEADVAGSEIATLLAEGPASQTTPSASGWRA